MQEGNAGWLETARLDLAAIGIPVDGISLIREKDGITLTRIHSADGTSILKSFESESGRREIPNYRMLANLGVPTMKVLATTERALLLEDIEASDEWRLGVESDLADPGVATGLAAWYRALHETGREFLANSVELYDETSVITRQNLRAIAESTGTRELRIWWELDDYLDEILSIVARLPRTLTHNDFYWTNLVVSRDGETAMMVDYDLLGAGYAYGDVRNVCSSLSQEAASVFRDAYGPVSEVEELADRVIAPLVALHHARFRPTFPSWAEESRTILTTELEERVHVLLAHSRSSS